MIILQIILWGIGIFIIFSVAYASEFSFKELEKYIEFQYGVWLTYVLLMLYIWIIWNIIQFIK